MFNTEYNLTAVLVWGRGFGVGFSNKMDVYKKTFNTQYNMMTVQVWGWALFPNKMDVYTVQGDVQHQHNQTTVVVWGWWFGQGFSNKMDVYRKMFNTQYNLMTVQVWGWGFDVGFSNMVDVYVLLLILYVTGPSFRYRCDGRGVCTCVS